MSAGTPASSESFRKLFCGGLSFNTTKETLSEYFSKFGTISDCVVMKDAVTSRSKCFGFVTFENPDSVDAAQSMRPHSIDGKTIDTKRAIPKDDPSPESRYVSTKIFVGGLKKEINRDQIRAYFENFGNVTEVILVTDKATGASKGFGFVTFDDADSVDKVIINKPHNIESSRADVKKALSKEEIEQIRMKSGGQHGQSHYQGHGGYQADPSGWSSGVGSQMQDYGQSVGWGSVDYRAGYSSGVAPGGYYEDLSGSQASGAWEQYGAASGANGYPGQADYGVADWSSDPMTQNFGEYKQESRGRSGGPMRGRGSRGGSSQSGGSFERRGGGYSNGRGNMRGGGSDSRGGRGRGGSGFSSRGSNRGRGASRGMAPPVIQG